MYDKLIEMVNYGQYEKVLEELNQYDINDYTEELTIIAASSLLAMGNYDNAWKYLQLGLQMNCKSDELYLLLGNYYENNNLKQAYFCYENAEFYCRDMQDKEIIQGFKRRIEEKIGIKDRKISIILLYHSCRNDIEYYIEKIDKSISFSYEIIVVNCSTDEPLKYEKHWKNVILISSIDYTGYPCAYCRGIEAADSQSDILLLDANTDLCPNSLFWLKMALYDDDRIGIAGCQEYNKFVNETNSSIRNFYEIKFYLEKSPLLIRREIINEIGLLDINFMQECFCYRDFGIRVSMAGWKNVLCHNSYFYFSQKQKNNLLVKVDDSLNDKDIFRFKTKWNFDILYDVDTRKKLLGLIEKEKSEDICVLEIGCGLGEMLAEIQFKYPNSKVYGIEFQSEIVEIGSLLLNIELCDIEKFYIPFGNIKFDYIILADTLGHFHDPERILYKLKRRLKAGGSFLCSVPNFMHLSVMRPLLLGDFEYKGILDRKYFKFFTLNSVRRLYEKCGFYIEKLENIENITDMGGEQEFLENISKTLECADKRKFLAYQYFFRAKICAVNKEVRITAVGMIKNAADVIETYIRSNSLVVDNFVLLDNMCTDRTIFILEELRNEGFEIEIIKDDMIEHDQWKKMNKLIYYVNKKYNSDFIIPIDDDECVVPFSADDTIENVRTLIEQLLQDKLYYLKWRIYVPNETDDENVISVVKRQTFCYEDEAECPNKVIIPKGVLEDGTFRILPGNHEGRGNSIKEHVTLSFARMAHFPCRSEEQVRSKALTGWTNLLAFPGRTPIEGYQWKQMYTIAKKGEKISLNEMQNMASLYITFSKEEDVHIDKKPVNLPEEAMIIKYTKKDEVRPWENYCTNVEFLAQKYVELLKEKYIYIKKL